MKKLLIGLLALGSISSFAVETCLLTQNVSDCRVSCNSYDLEIEGTTCSKALNDRLNSGYKIFDIKQISVASGNGRLAVLYTLLKGYEE
ncbi:MAG: hypothetical protein N4A33_10770 [Bacteriovoracaceae bacterium]|jgi:hypothetical protein|nr:hypothetical protein [Bacteriovoracaceae bacterium]